MADDEYNWREDECMKDCLYQEPEYYYDEDGKKQEVGPSFMDFPGMVTIEGDIELCTACENHEFSEKKDRFLCKQYGEVPKKYAEAESYDCPHFNNRHNCWYGLIKDKIPKNKRK